jgi:hypothetical protein
MEHLGGKLFLILIEMDLTTGDGFREIRYADTSANRPYVHWRAAE